MNNRYKILVIDDDYAIRDACVQILSRNGSHVAVAENGHTGIHLLGQNSFDIVILDMKLPDMEGFRILEILHTQYPQSTVIVITAYPTVEYAVKAIKMGAYDYIPKPFTPNMLRNTVVRVLERRRTDVVNEIKSPEFSDYQGPDIIIGASPAITQLRQFIVKAGMSDCSVLITGETGTGKELVARALHYCSRRRNNNFITIDSGGLADTLIESELFGHVRGAFTGAYTDRVGRFEMANRGTLFFDEISNMSYNIQSKLLRVLQEQEFSRVGSSHPVEVNVRIISATNKEISSEIISGNFREDLYYRLNVISVHLPPLRERSMDIPILADYFLKLFRKRKVVVETGQKNIVTPEKVSDTAIRKMIDYSWPGNVRELKSLMERAVALGDTCEVDPFEQGNMEIGLKPSSFCHRQYEMNRDEFETDTYPLSLSSPTKIREQSSISIENVEKEHIQKALIKFHYNKTRTAQMLGIDRKTLRKKIQKYDILDIDDPISNF